MKRGWLWAFHSQGSRTEANYFLADGARHEAIERDRRSSSTSQRMLWLLVCDVHPLRHSHAQARGQPRPPAGLRGGGGVSTKRSSHGGTTWERLQGLLKCRRLLMHPKSLLFPLHSAHSWITGELRLSAEGLPHINTWTRKSVCVNMYIYIYSLHTAHCQNVHLPQAGVI